MVTRTKGKDVAEPPLVTRVRSLLARTRGVVEKRGFGAAMFMVRGKMCVNARAQGIMCRVGESAHDAAVKRKGVTAVVMKGRVYRGFVRVAAEVLRTKPALAQWVKLALEENRRSAGKKKR